MSEERFIGYFRLVEACAEPGCPVCRCVTHESRSYLDSLLYEQVTDPGTRRVIRAAWGFCNWHTWLLLEIGSSRFGAAIIYDDLVRLALSRTERLAARAGQSRGRRWLRALFGGARRPGVMDLYRARAACPACVHAADSERRYLDTIVKFIDDGDLQAGYARSDGLCVPHLFAALEGNPERHEARMLVDRTRAKWAGIGRDIGSFVAKHDYRNREPYTAEETASYTRAFEMFAGAKSVFGNDVHAPSSTRRASRHSMSPVKPATSAGDSRAPSRPVGEDVS
ncbi:MAG: hypothetical protein HY294_01000 [Candidatus Rokubacteria bacterium]|nr:hypothetical protein [Candidatus Rokubacteria bacterium]MBI3824557.1 hypothetical protein [Candidatus Rokubacteria bacterium]